MAADALWGALGAIGGVLAGGLAEFLRARSQFKRERWWQVYEDRRKRIEELYIVVEEVRESYGYSAGPLIKSLATGKLEPFEGKQVPWARLGMLVDLYAPTLEPELKGVQKAAENLGAVMGRVVVRDPNPRQDLKHLGDQLMAQLDVFNSACEALLTKLKEESSQLAQDVRTLTKI